MKGEVKDFKCDWKVPNKDGITTLKAMLQENSGDLKDATLSIEVPSGTVVSSLSSQATMSDLFELQDHLTQRIVESLELQLAFESKTGNLKTKLIIGGIKPAMLPKLDPADAHKGWNAPMGIAEAMAVGVPVVTSNRCGMPYMVRHGETGYLVPHGDARALAERMLALAADPGLVARLGRGGRAFAETLSWERTATATEAQLSRLLAEGG